MMGLQALFDLTGKHALVTGGNSGIGEAMARALGLAGAAVTLVARREHELQAAASRLGDDGIAADVIACDLADVNQVQGCARNALQRHGAIDILVNAAGVNLR
ncbi:MAG: SDR family NAD(P)-dependent oxidoreductase, partial [Acidobacteriota bacterium]